MWVCMAKALGMELLRVLDDSPFQSVFRQRNITAYVVTLVHYLSQNQNGVMQHSGLQSSIRICV